MRITLVRHGRSAHVLRERRVDAAGVRRWQADYDLAGIDPADTPPPTLLEWSARADLVLASDLARAIASAERLAPNHSIRVSPLLRESELEIPTWLPFRWPLVVWGLAIHAQWLSRVARGRGTSPNEAQRVTAAAEWLGELSREAPNMVVVTHGVFRRLLGIELVARGWRAERRIGGYRNWSAWSFAR